MIQSLLVADCDKCLHSEKRLTCEQIDAMVSHVLEKMEHIRVNEELASILAFHYSIIASANQSRYATVLDIGAYCNPGKTIWPWFESRQTLEDRFRDTRKYIKNLEEYTFDKIPKEKFKKVLERAYADIDRIEQDSTLTQQEIKEMINASLEASKNPEMEMMYTHTVANIYFRLANIKDIDDSDITAYFVDLENSPENKPLSDQALELSVYQRVDFMLEGGLVEKGEYDLLKKYLIEDVKAFLHGDEDEAILLERVKSSLKKLKQIGFDTEDREFVAETYYDIAKRRGLEIGGLLNDWLYK